MDLFQEITVWERISDTLAIKYCGLHHFESQQYAIQSADYFHLPITQAQLLASQKQCVELLLDECPKVRCDWYHSVPAAILAFHQQLKSDTAPHSVC